MLHILHRISIIENFHIHIQDPHATSLIPNHPPFSDSTHDFCPRYLLFPGNRIPGETLSKPHPPQKSNQLFIARLYTHPLRLKALLIFIPLTIPSSSNASDDISAKDPPGVDSIPAFCHMAYLPSISRVIVVKHFRGSDIHA